MRVDPVERARVRGDQLGEPARRDRLGLDAELLADPPDDPVHLAGEPVDEPGLEPTDGRLADHGRRRHEVDLHEPGRPGEERVHRDLDPGASTPPTYSPSGETMSKFVEVPKSTTMQGAP